MRMTDAPAMLDDLRRIAAEKAATMKPRTGKIEWQGRTIWVKRAVPPKASIWNRLQGLLAAMTGLPMLRPTTSPGGAEGLRIEAWRIAEFRRAGFRAPEVLGLTEEWILLEDLGQMVHKKIRKDKTMTDAEVEAACLACARALGALHKADMAHGRGKINDMVLLEGGGIGFIDFEEDVDRARMPTSDLQARDLWLFLCSVAAHEKRVPGLMPAAYAAYIDSNPDTSSRRQLKAAMKIVKPLLYLLWPLRNAMGDDAACAWRATWMLREKLT